MRNLKRVLSLALAAMMLIGMMVVGASAANLDFTDADEIKNTEAVEVMVALNVFNGVEDGSTFDPAGTLTREQMSKIIAYVMNGGKEPVLGVKDVPTYSDIDGIWSEKYIEYATSMGIIAGDGTGKFNPKDTLTGEQAAKMLLTAMGYNAEVFGFTGNNWATNTNRYANEAGLYEDLDGMDPSAPISRDDACQLAYNAIQARMMERDWSLNPDSGDITEGYKLGNNTLLNDKFSAKVFVGTFTADSNMNTSFKDGQIRVYGKLTTAEAGDPDVNATFTADVGVENVGEEYKVIFKDGNGGTANRPDDKDTIYGVFNTGNTEVLNATKADMGDQKSSDAEIVVDGTTYSTTNSVTVYTNYVTSGDPYSAINGNSTTNSALTGALKAQEVDTIKFVFDEDGKIYAAYVTEYAAGRVTGLSSTKVTISGVGSITLADNDIYEGIAKDDVVVYTKFYNTDNAKAFFTVTPAETVEGTLEGYKFDSGSYKNVVVDGETYKIDTPAVTIPVLTDDAIDNPATDSNIGYSVRLYMMNGMVVAIQNIGETTSKYAIVTEDAVGTSLTSALDPIKVSVMLADGTEAVYTVHKDSVKNADTAAIAAGDLVAGRLIEYTSINDGVIKIKSMVTGVADSYNNKITGTGSGAANVWDKTTKTLVYTTTTGAVASADAVAFVQVDDDFYAYNLRDLGTIANTTGGVRVSTYLVDGQVAAARLLLGSKPGSASSETLYGIVSGFVGSREIDDESYNVYTVAVGRDEDVTVNLSTGTLTVGDVVKFDEKPDGKYVDRDFLALIASDDTEESTESRTELAAIKEYNADKNLLSYYTGTSRADVNSGFTGSGLASITVDSEVKIFYIDAQNNENGEEIGVNAFDAATGYANAILHKNTEGNVDAIVIETSGKANLAKDAADKDTATTAFGTTTPVTITASATVSAVNTGSDSDNGAYSMSVVGGTSQPTGATFTVNVTCTGIDTDNASETVTLTFDGQTKDLTFTSTGSSTQSVTFIATNTASINIAVTARS